MSYDLMVFDPTSVPSKRAAFLEWYERQQSGDEEPPPSDDPKSLTPALQAWFAEMIETFPPLNGPLARDESVDNPKATDYGLGRTYVYACFAWSQAEAAYKQTVRLAQKHGIGFFDASSKEGDVYIPGAHGKLKKAPD